jgi:hypothetical protein
MRELLTIINLKRAKKGSRHCNPERIITRLPDRSMTFTEGLNHFSPILNNFAGTFARTAIISIPLPPPPDFLLLPAIGGTNKKSGGVETY